MSLPSKNRYEFIPIASIVALIFIGIFLLIVLIGRCLALNQSTVRSAQSLDLMIYKLPPKSNPPQQRVRPSTDLLLADNRDDSVTPIPVQRGPKNL